MIACDMFVRHFEDAAVLPEQLVIDIARVADPDLDEAACWRRHDDLVQFAGERMII